MTPARVIGQVRSPRPPASTRSSRPRRTTRVRAPPRSRRTSAPSPLPRRCRSSPTTCRARALEARPRDARATRHRGRASPASRTPAATTSRFRRLVVANRAAGARSRCSPATRSSSTAHCSPVPTASSPASATSTPCGTCGSWTRRARPTGPRARAAGRWPSSSRSSSRRAASGRSRRPGCVQGRPRPPRRHHLEPDVAARAVARGRHRRPHRARSSTARRSRLMTRRHRRRPRRHEDRRRPRRRRRPGARPSVGADTRGGGPRRCSTRWCDLGALAPRPRRHEHRRARMRRGLRRRHRRGERRGRLGDRLPARLDRDARARRARGGLGMPVAVVNDVHAHALGEALHGAGAGAPPYSWSPRAPVSAARSSSTGGCIRGAAASPVTSATCPRRGRRSPCPCGRLRPPRSDRLRARDVRRLPRTAAATTRWPTVARSSACRAGDDARRIRALAGRCARAHDRRARGRARPRRRDRERRRRRGGERWWTSTASAADASACRCSQDRRLRAALGADAAIVGGRRPRHAPHRRNQYDRLRPRHAARRAHRLVPGLPRRADAATPRTMAQVAEAAVAAARSPSGAGHRRHATHPRAVACPRSGCGRTATATSSSRRRSSMRSPSPCRCRDRRDRRHSARAAGRAEPRRDGRGGSASETGVLVMADCGSVDDGLAAADAGVDSSARRSRVHRRAAEDRGPRPRADR